MEKILNDEIFGKMEYDYSWTKKDSLFLFDKSYTVKIVAQAYKNDGIQKAQQDNYLRYRNFMQSHADEIKTKLQQYCKEFLQTDEKLDEILEPTTVIFEKDGSWGVLFDTDLDTENAVAFFVINDEIKVDRQDMFL